MTDRQRLDRRALRRLTRLSDALVDPQRRERTVVAALAAYVVLWTLYGVFAKGAQDVHFDMSELVTWAREPALGYWKHPPLAAYVVGAWFLIFPVADWAYYLLGAANAALTLWIVWRLAPADLGAEKRVLALALLTLIPFFNFHALKFNINTVLMPLWAATALCFLRSYETRSLRYAALAGLFAAGAMLGKHWSIVLLAGLAIAAVADPRRLDYFRSKAPWITIAVGLVVLAPHIAWLVRHDFSTLTFAVGVHSGRPAGAAFAAAAAYLAGSAAYVLVPVVLALIAIRPGVGQLRDSLTPATSERRLVALAFWLPLLLPAVIAPVIGLHLTALWSMSAWALLPVVLLASPTIMVPGRARLQILGVAVLFPFVMLLLSPAIGLAIHLRGGVMPYMAHAELLARQVETQWRAASRAPIRLVGGDANLAFGVAFYLPDEPSAFPDFSRMAAPWVDDARIAREGIALVCSAGDAACSAGVDALTKRHAAAQRAEVALTRSHFGFTGPSARYLIVLVPPHP